MKKNIIKLILIIIPSYVICQQDSLPRRMFMIAIEPGIVYAQQIGDDKIYTDFGMRFAPKASYFVGQNTLLGFMVEYEFANSNYTTYESYYGLSTYLRQYLSFWDVISKSKNSKTGKIREFRMLPFCEAMYSRGNLYYDKNDIVVKKDALQAVYIAARIGISLKTWKELYLSVHPNILYSFDSKQIRISPSASFEYIFYKKRKNP